jgi:hypothetical protein
VPLERNPIYPKFVLVHGRRSEYGKNHLRRSIISAQEKDDFKILTFDSLLESLESKNDLYLGVRKNEYIDLRSDAFLSESMFAWMPPDQIRVGTKFRANALKMRAQWCHFKPCGGKVMDVALAQVRRRPKKKKASVEPRMHASLCVATAGNSGRRSMPSCPARRCSSETGDRDRAEAAPTNALERDEIRLGW